jgi:DNA-binding NarL/FixJ family response regulator
VLEAGGSGYLPKSSTSAELLAAIRAVHAGRSYFGQSPPEDIQDVRPADLSSREVRVLRLVALGYTNREISEKLGVHKKTVDTFRCRLQKKLEVRSRAEVVRYALRNGLLDKMR